MPNFSKKEAYDMLAVYFECMQNAALAERQYAVQYPERRHPFKRPFERLAKRLRDTSMVHYQHARNMAPRNYNENNVVNILAYITAEPQLSIREIPRDLDLNYSFVQRTLKRHKLHPYHIVLESDAARNLIGMKLAARCLSPFHPYLHIPINIDRQQVTPIRFLAASDSTTTIKCNRF